MALLPDRAKAKQPFWYHHGHRLNVPGFDARIVAEHDGDAQRAEDKLNAALAFLAQHSPYRHKRLQELLPRLFIEPLSVAYGQCHYELGLCAIDYDYLLHVDTTFSHVALTLVHEGMHARLHHARIPYTWENRARVERVCTMAAIIVAKRMPGASSAYAMALGQHALPAEFHSARSEYERMLQHLRTLGWLGKAAYHLVRLREAFWPRRFDSAT